MAKPLRGLTLGRILSVTALFAWLFYEARVHHFCIAKCESNDGEIRFALQSAPCQQQNWIYKSLGLKCDEARSELDQRVRDRRVLQCHAEEHFIFSSWWRILGVSAFGLFAALRLHAQYQAEKQRASIQREQIHAVKLLAADAFQGHFGRSKGYESSINPGHRYKQKHGPLIEPHIDSKNQDSIQCNFKK
jgi:hypothetical protein